MPDLSDLIARVEAASGPDRELDVAIGFAAGRIRERDGNYLYATGNDSDMVVEPNAYDDHNAAQPLSYFTASLDAAMTLLPEGYKWRCGYSRHVPHNAEVVDYNSHKGTFVGESDHSRCLALLSAILRARQAMEPSHD